MKRPASMRRRTFPSAMLVAALAGVAILSSSAPAATWYVNPENGHRYALTDGPKSWTDAQAEAASLGAYLVTMTTQAEEDWVVARFRLSELGSQYTLGLFWIGPTDVGRDPGQWYRASREPLIHTRWRTGNPDHLGTERYVMWFTDMWDNRTNTNQTVPFTGPPRLVHGVMELSPPTQVRTPFAVPEPPGLVLATAGLLGAAPFVIRRRPRIS